MGHATWCGVLITVAGAIVAACGSSNSALESGDAGVNETDSSFQIGTDDGGGPSCKPLTCARQGIECGPSGDGCGGVIAECGTCTDGKRCGGPGAFAKCVVPTLLDGGDACTPKTCLEVGVQCGLAGDGCGGILQCGSCQPGFQCGADGFYSQCVSTGLGGPDGGACVPKTKSDVLGEGNANCGLQSDGCGGSVDLGLCAALSEFCGGGGPSKCGKGTLPDGGPTCVAKTCLDLAAKGITCGVHPDGCGGLTGECGLCSPPSTCGGGGVSSQCGGGVVLGGDGGSCTAITSCAQVGKTCGSIANGCGGVVTCTGTCLSGQVCNNATNLCAAPTGCTPIAKAVACAGKDCGVVGDGCGGTHSCTLSDGGTACPSGTVCGAKGVPNKCGGGGVVSADGGTCTPATKAALCAGRDCGYLADGCGGLVQCTAADGGTTCTTGKVCSNNVCTGAGGCTPLTLAACGTRNCGSIADGCGGLVSCGPSTCGGGAVCGLTTPNVCGSTGSCQAGPNNMCNLQQSCGGGGTTSVTGRVYAPNGTLPIYNATVWVPKVRGTLPAIATGTTCDTCSAELPALVYTNTDYKGDFTLSNVPVGTDIPIVVQVGKWRREVRVTTSACSATSLACNTGNATGRLNCLTRLPRTQAEDVAGIADVPASNNIPKLAITSGGRDTLQCLLAKIGVANSEFTQPSGTGRINLFAGSGGSNQYVSGHNGYTGAARDLPDQTTGLFDDVNKMLAYDALILSCEGNDDNGGSYSPSYAAHRQKMVDFANAGGRVFASHWQHSWVHKSSSAAWQSAVTFSHRDDFEEPMNANIDMSFTKGDAMARWLHFARGNTGTLGVISIDDAQHTITGVSSAARSWINIPIGSDYEGATNDTGASTLNSVQYLTMNTPVGVADAQQCGRIVVSDLHLSPNASDSDGTSTRDDVDGDFPGQSCTSTNFIDQQKLLAFMLFDLTSCVQTDPTPQCTPKTCANVNPAYPLQCGLADDGCGTTINCGACATPGDICGYGGQANKCGQPSCTPIAKATACAGKNCGQVPNGCGGLHDCGTCVLPQTCGGGGTANVCGAPSCTTKTCAQLGVACGPSGDGCSGNQNCGNCVPGVSTCGGGGTPGVCGAPSCSAQSCGNRCGTIPNGCGGILSCGGCPGGQVCGGGGSPNVCGSASCSPKTCTQVGATCGQASDGCGGLTTNCGSCTSGQVCFNNTCGTPQCTTTTCAAAGVACGPLADGCGGLLQCGSCPPGQTCGGGGVPGQCGGPACTPRTCAELGATCGQVADGCGGLTPSCGSCPGTQVCNNGVCQTACQPRTCADAGANCGSLADGCGGLVDCGPCPPGQTCGGNGSPNVCALPGGGIK